MGFGFVIGGWFAAVCTLLWILLLGETLRKEKEEEGGVKKEIDLNGFVEMREGVKRW